MKHFFMRFSWLQWFLLGACLLIFVGTVGLAFGYIAGAKDRENNLALSIAADTQVQYELGLKDFEAGNYALARQRFDYVLKQDPNYPGVVDILTETLMRLSEPIVQITEAPSFTLTPSPTPDTRQVDVLFAQAEEQFRNQSWKDLVQTIMALRDIDPIYRVNEVDRMLFLGLRFSGIGKILDEGNLEGGVYDLALVERFAPLDSQARIYQEWARLYQIGVSFWGVLPEKSVYYFSQLASAAPYLRDLSGFYAKDRYRLALLQYGDRLAQDGDWCLAFEQYKLAQTLLDDQGLQPTAIYAEQQCQLVDVPLTPTEETDIIWTPTITITPTLEVTLEVTPTPTIEVTPTPPLPEVTSEPSPTETEPVITPTITPTPESAP